MDADSPGAPRPEKLFGTVESLDGTVGPDGRRAGDVLLCLFLEEGETTTARASLTADQYGIADRAHMAGRGFVWIRGVLRRGARIGRIERVEEFHLARPNGVDAAP
ncbi:MAG: hypothetical protein FJX77_16520 [Armatimonadetes bacterium]|nr:hypothetical protein [Armatimonadota bacterium]